MQMELDRAPHLLIPQLAAYQHNIQLKCDRVPCLLISPVLVASLNSRLSISILVYLVETSTIVIIFLASDNVLLYKVLEYHLYEAKGTKFSSKSQWYKCNSFFGFLVYRELGTSFDFCLGLFYFLDGARPLLNTEVRVRFRYYHTVQR